MCIQGYVYTFVMYPAEELFIYYLVSVKVWLSFVICNVLNTLSGVEISECLSLVLENPLPNSFSTLS